MVSNSISGKNKLIWTKINLFTDYRLLEEIGKYTEQIQENHSKKFKGQQDLPRVYISLHF